MIAKTDHRCVIMVTAMLAAMGFFVGFLVSLRFSPRLLLARLRLLRRFFLLGRARLGRFCGSRLCAIAATAP